MLFSFEVPIRHLEEFSEDQDYIFALSFLFERKEYEDYVKGNHRKILVLDNSFNELHVAQRPEELMRIAERIYPDYVVSPDADTWTTEQIVESFLEMQRIGFSASTLIVPIRAPEEVHAVRNAGGKNFAIPYEFRPLFPRDFPWHLTHFLGLRDPMEIKMCLPRSCDTSMPIKLALQGMTVKEWILKCCPHEDTQPKFFDVEMTKEQILLAKQNIFDLRRIVDE